MASTLRCQLVTARDGCCCDASTNIHDQLRQLHVAGDATEQLRHDAELRFLYGFADSDVRHSFHGSEFGL
ncbi:MAG: hypothetical protein CL456_06960 [Acidimicrobiaceae bacterium]|nr:hypothetical protein [Acidimicrobiaceae bacterium]